MPLDYVMPDYTHFRGLRPTAAFGTALIRFSNAQIELLKLVMRHERDRATDPGYNRTNPFFWRAEQDMERAAIRMEKVRDEIFYALMEAPLWWPAGMMGCWDPDPKRPVVEAGRAVRGQFVHRFDGVDYFYN